jgi:uncharacterized repeat protein (TIGR01451 family)
MGVKKSKMYNRFIFISIIFLVSALNVWAAPDVNFIVSSNVSEVNYLDNATFNLVFTYNNSEDIENVIFNNTLPSGWTYITDSWNVTGNSSSVVFDSTDSNQIWTTNSSTNSSTINISFQAHSGCAPVNGSKNNANVTYQWQSGGIPQANVTVNNLSEAITLNVPELILTYAPRPQVSNLNEQDTWQITLLNNGTGDANSIKVSHNLDSGFTSTTFSQFTNGSSSFSGTGDDNNSSINWTIDIPANQTWHSYVYATPSTCDETLLDFNVSINAGSGACSYYTNSTVEETNLRRVRIIGDAYSAAIGENESHSIHVNVDCDAYRNFTITETRPSSQQIWLSNVSSTTNGLTTTYAQDGNATTWFFYNGTGGNFSSPFDFWITYAVYLNDTVANTAGEVVHNNFATSYYNDTGSVFTSFYSTDSVESTSTSSSVSNTVLEPSLSISKVSNEIEVSINETFTYTITVLNSGTSPAYNITLTDVLPDGTYFISSTETPQLQDDRSLTWNINSIGTSGSWNTVVTAQVNSTYESGSLVLANDSLMNTIDAVYYSYNQTSAADYEGTVRSYSGNTQEEVLVQKPPLSVVSDKATATIGELITYNISSDFLGAPANSVVLTNILPVGLTYINYTNTNGNISFTESGQNLIFDYGNITERLVYTIEIAAYINDTVGNNVGDTLNDDVQLVYENSTSGSTFVITESTSIDITEPSFNPSKITNQSVVSVNTSFTYTISFTNNGDSTAFNISVNDTLPDGIYYVSSTESLQSQNDQELIWNVPSLASSQSWNVIITSHVNETYESGDYIAANDTFFNSVNINYYSYNKTIAVNYNGTVRNYSDYVSQENIIQNPTIDLAVDLSSASIGELLTYTITSNFENSYGDSVIINYTLPDGVVFVNQTNSSQNTFSSVESGQILSYNWGNISQRETMLLTITGYINDSVSNIVGGTLIPSAQLFYDNSSGATFNYSDTAQTTITEPSDDLQKVANETTVSINQTFTYNLSFLNNGTDTAYNISLSDTFPDGIDYINSTETLLAQTGQELTWNILSLASGNLWGSIVTARINETYSSGEYVLANDTLFNQFSASYYSYNQTIANYYDGTVRSYSSDAQDSVVIDDPTLTLSQSASEVNIGDSLVYNLSSDFSQAPANEFIVENNLSNKIIFINYSNTTGPIAISQNGQNFTFNYGNLTERQVHEITINTCVNETGTITNYAQFEYENSSSGMTFITLRDVTASAGAPNISFSYSSLSGDNAGIYQTVQYLLNITNQGDGIAYNVSTTNVFADGLVYDTVNFGYNIFNDSSRTINWINTTIPANTSQLIYLNLTLNKTYTNGTEIEGGDTFVSSAVITYQSSNDTDCISYRKEYNDTGFVTITAGYLINDLPLLRKVMRTSDFTSNSNTNRELEIKDITFGKGTFGTTGNLIAQINFNYSSNINLSTIESDINVSQKKSFIHGLSSIDNVINKTLYVPRVVNATEVYICPGATSLAETVPTCENKVTIGVNQTSGGMTVTEDTIDGEDYYLVTNIQGTGGGEGSAPNLIDTTLSPSSGSFDTTFMFNVSYTDTENDVASFVNLELDGETNYSMNETDISDTNVIDGKSFYYNISGRTLGEANHTFKIYAADEANVTVNTTTFSGPNVTRNSNLVLTDDAYYGGSIYLYANYTDRNTGDPITPLGDSASCNITIKEFSITNEVMAFNSSGDELYGSSTTINVSSTEWNVTCTSDSFDLFSSSKIVLIPTTVPEFSDYTVLLVLITVISVFVVIRKKY